MRFFNLLLMSDCFDLVDRLSMGIDRNKAKFNTNIPSGQKKISPSKIEKDSTKKIPKEQKFISKDIKNYFSYNLKTDFGRAANSKNSVTYDLKSFDE